MTEGGPNLRIVASIAAAEVLVVPDAAPDPGPFDGGNGNEPPGAGVPPRRSSARGPGAGGDELVLRCALLPMTDMGNYERFLARHGGDFLFVPEWGWLAWDGRRWNSEEADAMVQRAAHATVKAIAEESHQVRLWQSWVDTLDVIDDKPWPRIDHRVEVKKERVITFADKLTGWCFASQSNAKLTCIVNLARHFLSVQPAKFDADPMVLNVQNGTLRFARRDDGPYVTFQPHQRGDFITRVSPTAYDIEAGCPLYDAFLERVQPDAAMRRHLHAWGGVALTGLPLAKMSFWYGLGRNGKGTAAEAWAYVAGDYAQSIPIESFLDQGRNKAAGQASPDIAKLIGVRLLRTSEPSRNAKLDEGLIKLLTGGDKISARHLNKEFFEFLPQFKLTMQGNHRPRIEGVDNGIWARILMVPWLVSIPEGEQDPGLPEKLRSEAPGILNRLIDGLCDFLDNGLSPTEAIRAATAEYREDSDPIGRFLAECTLATSSVEDCRVGGKQLYELYESWAKAQGEKPWSPKAFSHGLRDHGILKLKSSGVFYRHLRLTREVSEFKGEEIGFFEKEKR